MERFFNTAGPQKADINYTIDPLSRFNLDEILSLIYQQRYFVLHAPRQTGKTSCMLALRDYLNSQDDYIAVYANVEGGQASRNDVQSVVKSTVDTLAEGISPNFHANYHYSITSPSLPAHNRSASIIFVVAGLWRWVSPA